MLCKYLHHLFIYLFMLFAIAVNVRFSERYSFKHVLFKTTSNTSAILNDETKWHNFWRLLFKMYKEKNTKIKQCEKRHAYLFLFSAHMYWVSRLSDFISHGPFHSEFYRPATEIYGRYPITISSGQSNGGDKSCIYNANNRPRSVNKCV